jgi:hypothetical protein
MTQEGVESPTFDVMHGTDAKANLTRQLADTDTLGKQ